MSIQSPITTSGSTATGSGTTGGPTGSAAPDDTGVKQAAGQAVEQTKVVASEARQHVTALLDQTRGEVQQQVQQRSRQLSSGLDGLAGQLRSLRAGRPEEAGSLHHYLVDAEQKVSAWSQRLQQGGPETVLRDVRSYARRKPGTFLLAALGAGFVAGRAVRVGVAAAQEQDAQQSSPRGFVAGSNSYPSTSGVDPMATGSFPDGSLATASPIDPTVPAAGSGAFA